MSSSLTVCFDTAGQKGPKVPFLSHQTLHIVDLLWMALFITVEYLNETCRRANVRHEVRNTFLANLLDDHSAPGSREQLKALWSQWVKEKYTTEPQGTVNGGRFGFEDAPPKTDEKMEANGAGAAG